MKLLFIVLLTMIVAVAIALLAVEDPGYVLIAVGTWTVETTLVLSVIVWISTFGALYYSIRFISRLMGAPSGIKHWRQDRREQKAEKSLTRGLIDLAEGRWLAAEKRVVKYAADGHTPLLNYLAAARAAQAQGEDQRRDHYLKLAHENNPAADIAVGLTQAELQFNQNQLEQALATLRHLQQIAPKHAQVLKVLAKLYQRLGDWEHLIELLPTLRKRKVFDPEVIDEMSQQAYVSLLEDFLLQHGETSAALSAVWARLPKLAHENDQVLIAYVQGLIKMGDSDLAEPLIRHALHRHRNEHLMRLYGLVESTDPGQQLSYVEEMLVGHEGDANALLAAGRICLRARLWGKARSNLEASVNAQASMEAFNELGNLLDQLGEHDAALESYRAGLRLTPGCEHPVPITLHTKERALELSEKQELLTSAK